MNFVELICSRLSNREHVNTPIMTQKGLRNSPFLGSFFVRTPRQSPRQFSHSPPLRGHRNREHYSWKIQKNKGFPCKFSPSPLPSPYFALPMPSPEKSHTKSARAAGNPGLFLRKQARFLPNYWATLSTGHSPRRGGHEGVAGVRLGRKCGENEVKIIQTTCALFVERLHSSSV